MIDEGLVERIKELQRTNPDGKLKWMSFTYESGNNKHDPRAHDASYIQEFFDKLEADEITIDPWLEKKYGLGEPKQNELFVARLPKDIEEYEVQAYFAEWGEIENISVKEGKGYAFITFSDPAVIDSILAHYDDHKIRDEWIDCKRTAGRRGGKGKGRDRGRKGKGRDGGKGKGGDRGGKGKGRDGGKGNGGKGKGRPQPY